MTDDFFKRGQATSDDAGIESRRVDRAAAAETKRIDNAAATETGRVDDAALAESGRVDENLRTQLVFVEHRIRAIRLSNYIFYVAVLVACGLGFWRVTSLTHANHRLVKHSLQQTAMISTLVTTGRSDRMDANYVVCQRVDALSRSVRGEIVGQVLSQKPFEKQIQDLGFPGFNVQLADAKRRAALIKMTNCSPLKPPPQVKKAVPGSPASSAMTSTATLTNAAPLPAPSTTVTTTTTSR